MGYVEQYGAEGCAENRKIFVTRHEDEYKIDHEEEKLLGQNPH